jgi:hypothetical protein
MDTGPMLHHVVYTSQLRSDATCRGTALGLAGERFFASGNERNRDHPSGRLRLPRPLVRLVEHARGPDEPQHR